MKRRKVILLSFLAIVIIILGFFREYIFTGINSGSFLKNSDQIKWFLTLAFIVIFLSITFLFLKLSFENKKYAWLSVYVYLFLFCVSVIAALAGITFFSFEKVYPFVRVLAGIMQSPLVLVILIPFCLIANKSS